MYGSDGATMCSVLRRGLSLQTTVDNYPNSQDNPAREALTIKCVKVIVANFERLPAHDATGGLNVCYHTDGNNDGRGEGKEGGDAISAGADGNTVGGNGVVGGGGGGGGDEGVAAVGGAGAGDASLDGATDGWPSQHRQQQQDGGGRVIPAKFLQLISAGLSTDLDPKVIPARKTLPYCSDVACCWRCQGFCVPLSASSSAGLPSRVLCQVPKQNEPM